MTTNLDASHAYTLDTKDELGYLRDRFIFKDPELIYLDGNSLGRLPRATVRRMQDVVEQEWGEKLIRSWGEGWMGLPERLGAKIAAAVGAQPDEVIVADSTSVNLFRLALAAVRAKTQRFKILTDDLNFPSDLYVLQGICQLVGGRYIQRIPSADGINGPVDEIEAALDDNTALLTLSHTVFKSGYTYNMSRLTDLAHQAGAFVLWDLSHSAGSFPVKLNEARADLAVGCTYKYLNGGPGAPAFLYVRRSLQEQLGNPIQGWMGQENAFGFGLDFTAVAGIRRFTTGTPPVLSLAAVEPGLDLILEAGLERIRAKSIKQTEYFVALYHEYLKPLGFRLQSPTDPGQRGSHISLGHDDGWRINQALIKQMNVIPDFREPDNLRFGFAPLYTSYTDIYTAVIRLRTIAVDKLHEQYGEERTAVT